MAQKQSTSPWVWAFLLLLLASFVALILFLDQKIVTGSADDPKPAADSDRSSKPIIDFYNVLPDRDVEIPILEEDREAIENPSINKEVVVQSILQAGSFQSAADAERRKAELKPAQLDDGTWHRVLLGPFASNSQLSRAKNLLLANEISYMELSLRQ